MKRPQETKEITTDASLQLHTLSDKELVLVARPLVQLFLETCDDIGQGRDTWFSLGTTKNKDSLVAASHQFGGDVTIYDQDGYSLLRRVVELL